MSLTLTRLGCGQDRRSGSPGRYILICGFQYCLISALDSSILCFAWLVLGCGKTAMIVTVTPAMILRWCDKLRHVSPVH